MSGIVIHTLGLAKSRVFFIKRVIGQMDELVLQRGLTLPDVYVILSCKTDEAFLEQEYFERVATQYKHIQSNVKL